MASQIGKYWLEADVLGKQKFEEMGGKITDANAAEQAYFAEKTAGIEAQIIDGLNGRGIDGDAALAYYRSLLP